jgi:hypothetical protein
MPVKTKAQLQAEAAQIANETTKRANTALRVGNAMLDIVDSVGAVYDVTGLGVSSASTDNTAAISAAIATAAAAAGELWWPAGTYLVLSSITNLHSVRHRGPGIIQRGNDFFTVQPKSSTTNRLYISPTGSSSNDGVHQSQPMLSPQNAFDALANYGPVLEGTWRIVNAAGTWAGTAHRTQHTTPSKNPVIFEGPNVGGHPNVPTAIYDGTIGAVASDWAVRATGYGVQIDVQNVKFQNYIASGNGDGQGLLVDYGAALYFTNVHGSGSSYADVYCQGAQTIRGGGGIWSSPRGGQINSCGDVTIGYGAIPVRLNNNTVCGIEWARGSQGHADYLEFNDCAVGLDVFHDARVHVMGSNFKRCTTAAIRARTGGFFYNDLATPNSFNVGTVDANAIVFDCYAYAGESDADLWTSRSERRVAFNTASPTHTGTTAKTTVLSGIYQIPAGFLMDVNKKLRVRAYGDFPAASGTQIGVDFINGVGTGFEMDRIQVNGAPTGATNFIYEATVFPFNATIQRVFGELQVGGVPPRIQTPGPQCTMTTVQNVAITVKLASSSDTVIVRRVEVFLTG